jgi:hypothetical protein
MIVSIKDRPRRPMDWGNGRAVMPSPLTRLDMAAKRARIHIAASYQFRSALPRRLKTSRQDAWAFVLSRPSFQLVKLFF